jgi:hypothetical protein
MGIDSAYAWRLCTQGLEDFADETSVEAVKQELLEIHRFATGALVEDLERQRAQGQVETIQQPDGSTVTKVKSWLNPSTLAELGRTCQRIAALLAIGEAGPNGEGTASFSSTTINLIQPGDAAAFGARAEALAAARQEATITVEAFQEPPQPPQSEPEATEPPDAPQGATEPLQEQPEPTEPLTGWRARRAARKAQEAASGRPAVRFMPAPVRN